MSQVMLKSSDNHIFNVDIDVAIQIIFLKNMIDDTGVPTLPIPLPNISARVLTLIIDYLQYRVLPKGDDDIKAWDAEFVAMVDVPTLCQLATAASYLNIENLTGLTTQTIANMMKGKSVEELRDMFNIENDFTPEEEEEVRQENQWLFG